MLTQIKHLEHVVPTIARTAAAKHVLGVVAFAIQGAGAAGARVGKVTGRRRDEVAGISRPAEASVQVQLGPVVVVSVNLAVGLQHDGMARVALEVGQADLRAGVQEAVGGAHDASWAKRSGDDGGDSHFRTVLSI